MGGAVGLTTVRRWQVAPQSGCTMYFRPRKPTYITPLLVRPHIDNNAKLTAPTILQQITNIEILHDPQVPRYNQNGSLHILQNH